MTQKAFIIEKLSWYSGKDLSHDPRAKLKTLARFLQSHDLAVRVLLAPGSELPDDFALSSTDVTTRGLAFLRGGYQKWVRFVDRGGDPNDDAMLRRELDKLAT